MWKWIGPDRPIWKWSAQCSRSYPSSHFSINSQSSERYPTISMFWPTIETLSKDSPWTGRWPSECRSWHQTGCWCWHWGASRWRSARPGRAWSRSRSRGRSGRRSPPSAWPLPRKGTLGCWLATAAPWLGSPAKRCNVEPYKEIYCRLFYCLLVVKVNEKYDWGTHLRNTVGWKLTARTWNTAMSSK